MNIKFGWGQGIWLVYGLFAAGIMMLVYASTQQSIDLVDEQYYQKELKFQGRLDAQNRANARGALLELSGNSLHIKGDGLVQGSVYAYCPTQSQYDRKWILESRSSRAWALPLQTLAPAFYRLDVEWVDRGDTFFQSIDYRSQ